ncbi:fructosamine kinase family protein [Lentiprolixibacter aurantiacus]|uniref:Fructosamine kinase family protein n=1 Tax=Lentiprolixibacter aurantiacus TaxID=2993939 RepID=A0AAE3SME5_9FLAO|nr:fructosamine kinase family protein [Lentiprolixibacter aurantiacus]MCX2718499.1 fructosamine kinase family protein [Lentiprolixibacter aurantiacus]
MQAEIKEKLQVVLGAPIIRTRSVSGGDIAEAYLLETSTERLFCKFMQGTNALEMLLAEMTGLQQIRNTGIIKAPEVYFCEDFGVKVCLGMEFIESKSPSPGEMETLGEQLAIMHKTTSEKFGYHSDNFIGSLPQSNSEHSSWISFYVQERLVPQMQMAASRNLISKGEIPEAGRMIETLSSYFKDLIPALLHGDLWSGNYLISTAGEPYLIDPAVYYGDPAVDLAMTRLFGGFGSGFYHAYNENSGDIENEEDKTRLYQLYYLLVHLNLFGRSYYSSVKNIMEQYF